MPSPMLAQLDAKNAQPGIDAAAVTPSAAADLPTAPTRALWVGGAGTLVVDMASGNTVTFPNASGWMPISVKRVRDTGTATSIVAVY